MPKTRRRFVKPLAGVATAALGLSGLLVGSGAFAAAPTQDSAPTSGAAYQTQAKALMNSGDPSLQGVGRGANGTLVVTTVGKPGPAVQALQQKYDNVTVVKLTKPAQAFSANDVVGGAGYATPNSAGDALLLCSVGFTGWTPAGAPAVISAGHCANDGTDQAKGESALTVPTGDPAGGGAANNDDVALGADLGTFAFHQFGGPGTTAGANNDKNSIDVSTIDVNNKSLNLEPTVTDWTTPTDLASSTTAVKSIGSAAVGETATKSGRTTGVTSGPVIETDGWLSISGHWVYGFGVEGSTDLTKPIADHGDSGGAVFNGSTALGIVSGGGTFTDPNTDSQHSFLWAADLQNDLAHTGGYTLKLEVAAPVVTSPANNATVDGGSAITGTGPANAEIVLTPATGSPVTVKTDANGNWSTTVPQAPGQYSYSIVAKSGFNTSAPTALKLTVKLGAPAITTPANGSTLTTAPKAITGTGVPGAKVTLTGAATGTATVGPDGTWSITASLKLGRNQTVSATQDFAGQTSTASSSTFNVVPSAPAVTSPANNATFASDAAPTQVTGTGTAGATVTVTLNGKALGTATVGKDGTWTLKFGDGILWGANTLTATQSVDDVASDPATVTFTVTAPASPVAPGPGQPGASGSGSGHLANTGSDLTGPGIAAAAVLLLGAGLVVLRKRRTQTEAE